MNLRCLHVVLPLYSTPPPTQTIRQIKIIYVPTRRLFLFLFFFFCIGIRAILQFYRKRMWLCVEETLPLRYNKYYPVPSETQSLVGSPPCGTFRFPYKFFPMNRTRKSKSKTPARKRKNVSSISTYGR